MGRRLLWLASGMPTERTVGSLPLVSGVAVPVVRVAAVRDVLLRLPLPEHLLREGRDRDPVVPAATAGTRLPPQQLLPRSDHARHDRAGAVLPLRTSLRGQAASASALLYVLYTISVGGDFMSGRFFAMPFLVSVLMLSHILRTSRISRCAAAGLVRLQPAHAARAGEDDRQLRRRRGRGASQNGIKDERGHYHRITTCSFYSPFRDLPDHTWVREGLSFRNGPEKVTVQGSIGFYGLAAGPDKHLVDRNALSEPLLARLPVSPRLYFEFYSGHFFRDIPDGYVETVATRPEPDRRSR